MKRRFSAVWNKKLLGRGYLIVTGLLSGFFNGLFGSGGGMLCVPMLKSTGMDPKKAHATSISVIFPLTVFSAILYLTAGSVQLSDLYPLILPGILGAVVGALFLKKISNVWLKRIFGGFILFAAVRMLVA